MFALDWLAANIRIINNVTGAGVFSVQVLLALLQMNFQPDLLGVALITRGALIRPLAGMHTLVYLKRKNSTRRQVGGALEREREGRGERKCAPAYCLG